MLPEAVPSLPEFKEELADIFPATVGKRNLLLTLISKSSGGSSEGVRSLGQGSHRGVSIVVIFAHRLIVAIP